MSVEAWEWWGNDESLIWTVGSWAVEVGELDTPQLVIDYFEKPYNWPELFDGWIGSPSE
jgi:hypothetical protein